MTEGPGAEPTNLGFRPRSSDTPTWRWPAVHSWREHCQSQALPLERGQPHHNNISYIYLVANVSCSLILTQTENRRMKGGEACPRLHARAARTREGRQSVAKHCFDRCRRSYISSCLPIYVPSLMCTVTLASSLRERRELQPGFFFFFALNATRNVQY